MPVTVEVIDSLVTAGDLEQIFNYFDQIDRRFSTYKFDSEMSRMNRGEIKPADISALMKNMLELSEQTKNQTNGYFDIKKPDGTSDPSGLVKGWAIYNAAEILKKAGFKNYFIEAGGDVQVSGSNGQGKSWRVGIKNPFDQKQILKVVFLKSEGIATSGTYIRGQHIYNPHDIGQDIADIISLTVIGPNIYEADRFATAAFAMGKEGIVFIEKLPGFEGYMIDNNKIATMTSGFEEYANA
ncbi:MAG: FAD:protein FMN transferase [Candidatus Doudnabacteria bacterium]